ncbi:MAG: GPW/gp25 family protein [Bacteroidaceae bacterium]|nr:GPW/gp25 family protein [Bacteroidaceae bacterium]
MDIRLPLDIRNNRVERAATEDEGIRDNLELLITTPVGSIITDPDFGFIFNNLRFEIFDEQNGTIRDSAADSEIDMNYLYKEKISGTSKNINTFASELKSAIDRYEPRLTNVKVSMTHIRLEKKIYITINAQKKSDDSEFNLYTSYNIWN